VYIIFAQYERLSVVVMQYHILTCRVCAVLVVHYNICNILIQVNQDGLKLNGTHQLLVYAADVNILGGGVHTVKKNTEALVVASKEFQLEVNADRAKYMVMSRDQNAGRSQSTKIDNSSIERVEEFKYLGTTLTNQISIQEESKCRLKSGNSVQNLLSSSLLSQNIKINIYRTVILPFVLYGCETWSVTWGRNVG